MLVFNFIFLYLASFRILYTRVFGFRNDRCRNALLFISITLLLKRSTDQISLNGSWSRPTGNCWINFFRLSFLRPGGDHFRFSLTFSAISEMCSLKRYESALKQRQRNGPDPTGHPAAGRIFTAKVEKPCCYSRRGHIEARNRTVNDLQAFVDAPG